MSELKSLRISDSDKEELVPDSDDAIVYDPYYANLLNENREISIKGLTFRIIKEGVIICKDIDKNDAIDFVKTLRANRSMFSENEVFTNETVSFLPEPYLNPTDDRVTNKKLRTTTNKSCPTSGGGLFGHTHQCSQEYGGGTFRNKGRMWSQNFGNIASMGGETKHQKKQFGVWWGRDAEKIDLRANILDVGFEDSFGIPFIVDFSTPSWIVTERYNTHLFVDIIEVNTGILTTKPPYVYKLAKARKYKKYDTIHRTEKYGETVILNLTYN
jgi:hypothetical protein